MPLTKGTACIFGRLCPIFTMVCSTFYLSALQISLTLLGIAFSKTTLIFSLVPLDLEFDMDLTYKTRMSKR